MFISNVVTGPTTAQIWAAATRSLTVDPATDAGAATLVWQHSLSQPGRHLTSLYNCIDYGDTSRTSLAASGTVINMGSVGDIKFFGCSVDNVAVNIEQWDGTNGIRMNSATEPSVTGCLLTAGIGVRINNVTAGAINYMVNLRHTYNSNV